MRFLHAMIRINDPEESIDFYQNKLGLVLTRKNDSSGGKYSLYFFATHEGAPEIELTHNWDAQTYSSGNQFGHLAFEVDNIYDICQRLQENNVSILRPPRDGRMAFIKDPNGISIELLQKGAALKIQEPWSTMPNSGSW